MSKQNFHESFSEHHIVDGPSNKNFGFTVGGIFAAIGAIKGFFFSFSWFAIALLSIGGVLIALTLIVPHLLTPLNKAWMKLGLLLFFIVNPIIMGLLFLVCFIPAGLIMKLIGRDAMKRKFDKKAETYWIKKEDPELEDPMKYQF